MPAMDRRIGARRPDETSAEAACRLMEAWLTWALEQPEHAFPRIPLRPVAEGGFEGLLARPEGRRRAEGWWAGAMSRVEAFPPWWG